MGEGDARSILDHPIVRYLIIGFFSVGASIVLFLVGDSLAEVFGEEGTILGFGFKASGAVAGFLITFWTSPRMIERLQPASDPVNLTLYLSGEPVQFSSGHNDYRCEGRVYNKRTGKERRFPLRPRWEVGFLTVDFRDIRADDLISVRVQDHERMTWEFDYFSPLQLQKGISSHSTVDKEGAR